MDREDVSDPFFTCLNCLINLLRIFKAVVRRIKSEIILGHDLHVKLASEQCHYVSDADKLVFEIPWFGNIFACEPG